MSYSFSNRTLQPIGLDFAGRLFVVVQPQTHIYLPSTPPVFPTRVKRRFTEDHDAHVFEWLGPFCSGEDDPDDF